MRMTTRKPHGMELEHGQVQNWRLNHQVQVHPSQRALALRLHDSQQILRGLWISVETDWITMNVMQYYTGYPHL